MEVNMLKVSTRSSPYAISVIIPMYNVEEYISECLDSLLSQTFQNFEVIVVDDCSTDNSVKVVESYVDKFAGRLLLLGLEKNSGGGSKPRNFGLKFATGQYIFFMDSDDFIMLHALETLYNAAKEYDAEVVYYAAHYDLRKPNDIYLHRDGFGRKLLKEGLEDKPTLTVNDIDKILRELLLVEEGNLCGPCTKFIRRDFLLKNEIVFPDIAIGEDFIWCINVYCHTKRFLRLPVSLYFYRRYNTKSVSQTKREPAEQISRWVTKFVAWLRFLSELESKNEILSKNPVYCLAASKRHFQWSLGFMNEARKQLSDEEIYEILSNEFAKENDSTSLAIPFFFSIIHSDKKAYEEYKKKFRELLNKFTSRIDIKFVPKNMTGSFQILSVSDDKADIFEPAWLQKGGNGYQVQSYACYMKIVAKATSDGQIKLDLRALDVRDPKDNSKRVPCWIDYTKLTVNGKIVFDGVIPTWHDKPYKHLIEISSDEEITLQIEWLPHKSLSLNPTANKLRENIEDVLLSVADKNPAVSIIIPVYNAEKFIGELLDSILVQTFQDFEVIIVDDCSKDSSCEVIESYIPKFDGRLSLYHMSKNSGSAPAPRNNGFLVSRGEYIFFMDSDDTLTQTALEEMYTLAKEYGADVVYCEKYYMSTGVGEEYVKNIHLADNRIQKPPFVDKPTFVSDKLADRLDDLFNGKFWVTPWQRFVSRKLLAENEITFPEIIGCDDVVWCFLVLCFSKKFLRVPNICYVRRMYDESFTQSSKKSPNKHIHQWLDITVRGIKFVNKYVERLNFFSDNPDYRYKALNMLASTPFGVVAPVCSNLSSEKLYDIFLTEFSKDTGDNNVLVSLLFTRLFSQIQNQKTSAQLPNPDKYSPKESKLTNEQIAKIKQIKTKAEDFLSSKKVLPALSSTTPAISVVIPMYNAEELLAECLNSLLVQTFTDFELIIVDDCSTDNSCAIVDSYEEKFSGRIKLAHTETNSGGGGYVPRNVGLKLASGEYIYFMDADDFILDNALETFYTSAKEYDADVVYSGSYYNVKTPEDIYIHQDDETRSLSVDGLEDKPDLRVDEPNKNLSKLLLEGKDGNFRGPWTKLIRRKTLIENNIVFPTQITNGGDFIWVIDLYCHTRKFLRISTPIYFYRSYNTKSVTNIKRDPAQHIAHWISGFVDFLTLLRALENEHDILSVNPSYCFKALENHFRWYLGRCYEERNQLSQQEIYEVLHSEFGKDSSDLSVPFFFSTIDAKQKEIESIRKKYKPVLNELTARIDIRLVSKENGDFQILSVSDDKATVSKAGWLPTNEIGYAIQSYEGDLRIVAKAISDGQIKLWLLGLDIRNSEDKAKRIPYWIDYTKLIVNGKIILDKLTPAWHDKPYRYNLDVKAGDKIEVQVNWQPHRSVESLVGKFLSYFTARVDLKLVSKTKTGDFQILSVSDDRANILKPDWLQKDGIGYQIQSYNSKMELVAKATSNGQIELWLLGLDIRDPEDKSKRIPYWIDYTKFTVNGAVIFNKLTPVWHDKPYRYKLDVKAGEEIKIEVEWLPHRDDRTDLSVDPTKEQEKNAEMLRKSEALVAELRATLDSERKSASEKNSLVSELRTALDNEKKSADEKNALVSELRTALETEKEVHSDDVELIRKFSDYFTARLDFRFALNGEGDFQIVSVSDEKATVKKVSRWLSANEVGYSVQSYVGKMEIVAKVVGGGQFNLNLKGMDIRDPDNKSKRIPYWIDYTKLTVNGEIIFDSIKPVWHDKPYSYALNVNADEEIKIEVEWLPHSDKQSEEPNVPIAKELAEQKALVSELRADLDTEKKSSEEQNALVTELRAALDSEKKDAGKQNALISELQAALDSERKSSDEQNALVAELRAALDTEKKVHGDDVELIRKFSNYFTARLDFKIALNGEGDFQIVSVSDEKATVKKVSRWLSANEVGYSVQSYVGKMEIVAKVVGGGQFNLNLKGKDVRDPQNRRKRIPYWIDYTKLTVNGEIIFDSITPVWHDKPYSYALDVKADEEIKIEVEWLPHSDKQSEEQDVQVAKKLEEQSALISELQAALDSERKSSDEQNALVAELRAALDTEKKVHGDDVELIRKFSNYFTARLDFKIALNGEGDFQIVSVSDEKATVKKVSRWLSANEVGYSVQSYVGKMEIVAKVVGGGQFNLNLKGKDVRDPQNRRKRVPYWIDYTKLTINGEIVFDELTPVWHDKPYSYALDVNVDEEIKIEVEWLPHSDKQSEEQDVQVAKKLEEQSALISELQAALDSEKKSSDEQNALVAELRTELDNEKKATDEQNALVSELRAALDNEKKVHGDDVELIRKFSNYFTARLDFKLMPSGEGDFKILSVSDEKAVVKKARGLSANEVGYSVQSYVGKMEIVGKVTGGGQFNLNLKGKDVRDPQNKKKRIPYWIDYTNLTVNGEVILDKVTPVWHNEPYNYIFYAKADEEIRVEVEWVPHKGDN